MNRRAALTLLTLAGLPAAAAAQVSITYSWTWSEVLAHSSTPVSSPNGLIEPGEGARLSLTTTITPGIGSTVTYTPPPAPGFGRLAGLGRVHFDLLGSGALGGGWSSISRTSAGFNWGWGEPGTGQPSGDLLSAQAGQYVFQGSVAIPDNPIIGIWRGTWTPADYTPRLAAFQSTAAAAAGPNHSAVLIEYGEDPSPQGPFYVGSFVPGLFGNTGPIPIVPAPASPVLLCLCGLAAARRRRSIHVAPQGSAP